MKQKTPSKQFLQFISVHLVMAYMLVMPFSFNVQAAVPTPPTAPSGPSSTPVSPSIPDSPKTPEAPKTPSYGDEDEEVIQNTEESTGTEQNADITNSNEDTSSTDKDSSEQSKTEESNSTSEPTHKTTTSNTDSNKNGVGDSEIETGDATTTVNASNNANTNTAATPTSSNDGGIDLTNTGNGSDSTNDNSVNLSDKDTAVQINNAAIDNGVNADSLTGNNDNSKNVGNSKTNTGNSNTSATIITTANTNADGIQANEFNVLEDHVGDIVLDANNPCASGCQAGDVVVIKNGGNGSDSDNSNDVTIQDKDETFQYNDAQVENDLVLKSNSGDNTSNDNTGGDTEINTGDANTSANLVSFLNNNVAGEVVINTVNVFGNLVGNIIAPESTDGSSCGSCGDAGSVQASNTGNGSNSTNQNEFTHSSDDLVYQNNDAEITNNLKLDTNTGGNSGKDNTGGDTEINTGETSTDVNVMNVANQNVAGDWWIVLVNQAGQWVGQIMGAPEGANMAGSAGTQFIVHDDGSIDIVNSENGSGSDNSNNVNNSSSKTIVQENNATLHNNLDLSANTGGNSASRNTGGSSEINTGDANIVANLVNFVNNNIAGGGRVTVTVINVFGSWLGDFVAPGQQARQVAKTTENQLPSLYESEQQAVGGYVQEVEKSETTTETEESESGNGTTVVSETQNFLARIQSDSLVGKRTVSSNGQVLGSNNQASEELTPATEETVNAQYTTAQSNEKQPLKIKVTWPALITSLLGLVYAGFRARYFFA